MIYFVRGFRVAMVGDLGGKKGEPAKPFVILPREGHPEQAHSMLADAVKAAQSGDTIEIRGDGPFLMDTVNLDQKALALQAGAGFRPVLRRDPPAALVCPPPLAADRDL